MIGQIIGEFEIVRELGRGGMGMVLEARDRMLGRRVAIKVVRSELAGDPVLAERFRKEAQALARLNHVNVTSVYSLFRRDDQLFLVMELIEGESLEARLRARGVLPWRQAVELTVAALDGLRHAHDNGIIHRDVKPANLFLPLAGGIKIMDFGIAHILGQGRLTQHGTAVGTLAYMSPEQITGGELDPRTDLYSLGVVLYEMVTGRVPFRADSDFAIMRAHLEQAPEAPRSLAPNLPDWLEAAIVRSLAKDPGRRYGTAADLAAELRRGLELTDEAETEPTRMLPPPSPTPPPRAAAVHATMATTVVGPRRRRLLPLAALGLVAVASAALVVMLQRSEPAAGPPPVAAPAASPETPPPAAPAASPETPPPAAPAASPETPPPAAPAASPETPPPAAPAASPETPPPAAPAASPETPPPAAPSPPPPVETSPTPPPEPAAAAALDPDELLMEVAEVADRLPPVSERLQDYYGDYRDALEDDETRAKPEDETLAQRLDAFLEATELLRRSVNVVAEREGLTRRRGLRRFATKVRSKLSSADRRTVWTRVDQVLEEGGLIRELLEHANSDEPTRTIWRQIQADLTRLERLRAHKP